MVGKRKTIFFTNDEISSKLFSEVSLVNQKVFKVGKGSSFRFLLNEIFIPETTFIFFSTNFLVKSSLLNYPELNFFNIHPSIIPKGIGPSPINNSILTKLGIVGVSLLKMTFLLDKGFLLNKVTLPTFKFESYLLLKHKVSKYSTILNLYITRRLYSPKLFKGKSYTSTTKLKGVFMLSKGKLAQPWLKAVSYKTKLHVNTTCFSWKVSALHTITLSFGITVNLRRLLLPLNGLECLDCLNRYGFIYKIGVKLTLMKVRLLNIGTIKKVFV